MPEKMKAIKTSWGRRWVVLVKMEEKKIALVELIPKNNSKKSKETTRRMTTSIIKKIR